MQFMVAVRQAVAGSAQTPEAVAARFAGVRRADVLEVLDALVLEVLDALAELALVHAEGGAFSA